MLIKFRGPVDQSPQKTNPKIFYDPGYEKIQAIMQTMTFTNFFEVDSVGERKVVIRAVDSVDDKVI